MSSRSEPQACSKDTNEIVEWSSDRVQIDIRRFATRTEGRAMIVFKALAERALLDEDQKKDAKRDGG